MKHASAVVAISCALLGAAVFVAPSGAHDNDRPRHLWRKHVKPRLSRDGRINRSRNPVDWTRLKNVPMGFADGRDSVGPSEASGLDCRRCVDTADLAGDAVTRAKILNGTIAQADLAFNPATQAELDALGTGDGTINQGGDPLHWTKLQGVPGGFADGTDDVDGGTADDLVCTGCVGTTDIEGLAVTTAKLEGLSVTTAKLDDLSVTGDKLALNSVNQSKLTDNAVGTDEIDDDTIDDIDIADNSLDATSLEDDSVGVGELSNDAVDTAAIQDGAVTGAVAPVDPPAPGSKIAVDTIGAANLAVGSVSASELADDAVDTAALQGGAVTPEKITANAATTESPLGSPVAPVPDSEFFPAVPAVLEVTDADSELHSVLVSAQASVTCACGSGETLTVTWQLFDGDSLAIGPQYTATLNEHVLSVVTPVTAIHWAESSPAGTTHEYQLRITTAGTGTAAVAGAYATATDQGRQ